MDKIEDKLVIGRASIYNKTYYYNPFFQKLPEPVKDEIQEICTFYAEKLHCVFSVKFDEEGEVYFETAAEEWDANYDEIGAKLDVDKLVRERKELFKALKLWYMVFVMKINADELPESE